MKRKALLTVLIGVGLSLIAICSVRGTTTAGGWVRLVVSSVTTQTSLPVSSGLRLWLRSDMGLAVDGSGKVQTWADQSASGNDFTQDTANARPTLTAGSGPGGTDVLHFDGVDDLLSSPAQIVGGTSVTIFTVMAVREPGYPWVLGESYSCDNRDGLPRRLFYEGHPGGGVDSPDFFDVCHDCWNDARASFPGINDTQFKVLTITGSDRIHNVRVFVDGAAAVMTPQTINTELTFSPGNALGFVHSTPNAYTEVDFAEFIVYDRELNQTERELVEAYLISRYPASSVPPTLGNYPDTTVQAGANTTVTPDTAPTNTTSMNVSTTSDFRGAFAANPTTGVVQVTNAHPAGTYIVTVTAFNSVGATTTKTFTLTVNNATHCDFSSFSDASGSPFTVGSYPNSVAVGDFNGDGKQDVTTANANSDSVTVLLGNSSGGFSPASGSPFAVGGSDPLSVAIGDFNGDGNLDLTTANLNSQNVTVLLGNGSGGFSPASGSPFAVGATPVSVAVGDFNGDGKQDLTTANYFFDNVTVLLGDGSGGFGEASGSPFTVGTRPSSVVVGDFNGDGKLDLTTTNDTSNNVTVLLGNGSGGFSEASGSPFAVVSGPYAVAIGDFNGDGKQDLATTNYLSNNVTVLLGNGSGGFSEASGSPFAVGSQPWSVAVGDFNGDGEQDLATANHNSENVTVLLGNGSGGFSAASASPFAIGSNPFSVAVGDFNGDGKLDLTTANATSNNVTVLLNTCTPNTAATVAVINTNDSGAGSLRDAINQANSNGAPSEITFNAGLAGQTIQLQSPLPPLTENGTTINGDVNGDCHPDIELDGQLVNDDGIKVFSSNNVIRGLIINRFGRAGVDISGGQNNHVECNYIGTDAAGTQNRGNGGSGVRVDGGASDNQVGPGNIIAFNATGGGPEGGVAVLDGANFAYPNFTGRTPDYTGRFPVINFPNTSGAFRSVDGITPIDGSGHRFADTFGARFTGTLTVGATGSYTFTISNPDDQVQVVVDSVVILQASCCSSSYQTTISLSAGGHTIEVDYFDGPGAAGFRLDIAGPGSVALTTGGQTGLFGEFFQLRIPSERNRITQNSIFGNNRLGIELDALEDNSGVNPNDQGDGDIGPNTALNFPEFNFVTDNGGGSFKLDGKAPPNSTVEIFATTGDDPSGHGEGKLYLTSVTANGGGGFSATITAPAGYSKVTATATDSAGNTSEFSRNQMLTQSRWGQTPIFSNIPDISGPTGYVTGDLNGDGRLDLVAVGHGNNSPCRLLVLRQNSSGRYDGISQEPMGANEGLCDGRDALALGDVDGDGDLDLIAQGTDNTSTRRLLLFLNDGTGTLAQQPDIFGPGLFQGAVALGDLDGDGDLDLAASGQDGNSAERFLIFDNNGAGGFTLTQQPRGVNAGYIHGSSLVLGDIDSDGDLDIVISGGGNSGRSLHVYKNTAGQLSLDQQLVVGPEGLNNSLLRLADLDRDGDLDLVAAGNNFDGVRERVRLVTFQNQGQGFSNGFTTLQELTGGRWAGLAVGDCNGDGYPDVFANGHDGFNFRLFYFQSQSGTLVEAEQPQVSFVGPIVFGDFDSDNDLDMVGLPVRSLYTNLLGPANAAPGIPSGLTAMAGPSGLNPVADLTAFGLAGTVGELMTLTWAAPSDAESGSSALSYELRLGTAPGQYNRISGTYGTPLMGTYPLGRVSPGQPGRRLSLSEGTYYWQVRAIDTGLRAGGWSAESSFVVQPSLPPTLGNYPDTTVQAGANTMVTPDAAPSNTTTMNVSTASAFTGAFAANPTTGVVMVTNAQPAGTYIVTVRAFNGVGVTTTKTFTLTVTNPTPCGLLSFSGASGSPFTAGTQPWPVAVGDFNADGKQDVATANHIDSNVTVLLGNGGGGFSAASGSPFAVNPRPQSLAVGDFNADGKLDLATANSYSNVTVLLGDGSGSFTSASGSPFVVGSVPISVAVGDFNGDGKLDLSTANAGSSNVTVLLGDGGGGFSPASGSPFSVNSVPNSIALGDFNGDGKLDLTTANWESNNVTVLLGNGIGGFSPASTSPFTVGKNPCSIAVGDFNGDGKQDLATVNHSSSSVTVLLGDGSGGFSEASGSPLAGWGVQSVSVGDFNGDGNQDLTTANFGYGNVSVLLGDGGGGFSPASGSPFAVGTGPYSVAVGDFNGDGKLDLTTGNRVSNNVSVLLNDCANSPPAARCKNVTVSAGPNCAANASIDNGSFDPDSGDTITLTQTPPGPYPLGTTLVTLTVTDNHGASTQCTGTVTVLAPQLTSLSPAQLWLGLKNSDDVGTKFDLLAEVLKNGSVVGSGQLDGVPGGSSGFNNAVLRTINLALSAPVDVCSGDTLSIRLSVRIAVGVTGHRSGTARLWFNDAAADSRFGATIGGSTGDYFLLDGFTLGAAAGVGPRKTIDVFVDRAVGGNPFKAFGTWSKTF